MEKSTGTVVAAVSTVIRHQVHRHEQHGLCQFLALERQNTTDEELAKMIASHSTILSGGGQAIWKLHPSSQSNVCSSK